MLPNFQFISKYTIGVGGGGGHLDTLRETANYYDVTGQERVLSGSKYPDETARELVKHKNKGHKQLSMVILLKF